MVGVFGRQIAIRELKRNRKTFCYARNIRNQYRGIATLICRT